MKRQTVWGLVFVLLAGGCAAGLGLTPFQRAKRDINIAVAVANFALAVVEVFVDPEDTAKIREKLIATFLVVAAQMVVIEAFLPPEDIAGEVHAYADAEIAKLNERVSILQERYAVLLQGDATALNHVLDEPVPELESLNLQRGEI